MARRSKFQRERDLEVIARLYLEKKPIREIAEIISVDPDRPYTISHTTVAKDLKAIRTAWSESAMFDLDQRIAQELANIDNVEARAWEAFDRSIGRAETVTTETQPQQPQSEGDDGEAPTGRVVRKVQDINGDPRYLNIALNCVERRCKLLGLDAPTRTEVSGTGGSPLKVLVLPAQAESIEDWTAQAIRARDADE